MQLTGFVNMPKDLAKLIQQIGENNGYLQPPDIDRTGRNKTNYLSAIRRKADILLLCTFYGLYVSRQLPPFDLPEYTNATLDGKVEFGVNIEKSTNLLRHLLFTLWIIKKGKIKKITMDYRRELYSFLELILDEGFIVKTVIPFYLARAAEVIDGISFIGQLSSSRHIEWKMHPYAPERIALEFERQKKEFEKYIKTLIKPITK